MIGEQLLALGVRRERLRARADAQRGAIAASAVGLHGPLRLVDRAVGGVRWLKVNPAAAVAVLVAVVLVRPRGVVTLAGGGLRLWAAWRALSALRAPQTRGAWALLTRGLDLYRSLRGRR